MGRCLGANTKRTTCRLRLFWRGLATLTLLYVQKPLAWPVFVCTIIGLEIEFDPAKDAANVDKHGLSLADAASFDLAAAVVVVDDRADYGETRFRAFGRIDGLGHCLVFTYSDEAVRVISFRRAHEKEMRRYE